MMAFQLNGTETVGIVIPAYRPNVSILEQYIETLRSELEPETIRVELDAAHQKSPTDFAST
ncbi:MAG: hypothetical protein U5K37_02100 [Natrialbaceae archaeon]|nr:hypothetical protein [Natrialbaceae archaeon]